MPTLVCTNDDLALQSSCYRCVTDNQASAIELYLLAKIAGLDSQTPEQITNAARCWNCIPSFMQQAVSLYLMCQQSQPSTGCSARALVVYGRCFECLTGIQLVAARLYLLAIKAGLEGSTLAELYDLAKCWTCIPAGLRFPVKNYLLCYGLGSCDPETVNNEAACYRCLNGMVNTVELGLLCWWNGTPPPVNQIVLGNPDTDVVFGDPNSGIIFGIP